jgi:pilus assembly protein Flp/PilA
MNNAFLKLYVALESFRASEDGQDLVEYALLLTLISFALVSSMNGIASAIKTAFSNVSSSLT